MEMIGTRVLLSPNSRRSSPRRSTTKPKVMVARPVRIHARNVRSFAKWSVTFLLVLCRLGILPISSLTNYIFLLIHLSLRLCGVVGQVLTHQYKCRPDAIGRKGIRHHLGNTLSRSPTG